MAVLGVLVLVERASWNLPLGALVVLAGVVVAQAAYVPAPAPGCTAGPPFRSSGALQLLTTQPATTVLRAQQELRAHIVLTASTALTSAARRGRSRALALKIRGTEGDVGL